MQVQHACHAIEPEAVNLVLVHPESEVAEEKAHDFVMAVVEQPTVPLLVASPATRVEVLVISPIELIQPVENVLGGVTVHNIQKDDESQTVGGVDKLFQIFGGTVPTAGGEKVVDLVAKTCVVGVLHNSHELNDVVPKLLYPWNHSLGKLLVGGDPQLW